MSDELALTARLSFNKGGASVTRAVNITVDITGDAYTNGVQSITTDADQVLALGAALGTPGYVIVKNLDDTNFVTLGIEKTSWAIKIKAGEVSMWRHNGATIPIIADTDACLVEYIIIED